jgi:hypothetical protein
MSDERVNDALSVVNLSAIACSSAAPSSYDALVAALSVAGI